MVASAIGITYAAQVASAGPDTSGSAPTFTAVEITDAVIYREGPAAKLLGELERPNIEWTEDVKKSRETIAKALESDERFGQSYASRMQSGDPVQIGNALDDLAKFSREAMNKVLGKDNVDRAIDAAGEGSLGRALVWHTWVYIYKYIVFLRYVVIAWAAEIKDVSSNGRLPDELTIRAIAVNLNARG
ncbi:hypothetical protein Rhe02_95870 [Rhizocola hellebori]|uniref:Uncharacterized protein n=1 Tax=Rhizocola hellebori TaxID=1392758 RepID=A0A8J3QIK3_9ACTN|nr:hypothetical protein Rhe02_95870 [Rhizocola hellebori]